MGCLQWQWCPSCTSKKPVERTDLGSLCCTHCGKILEDNIFSDEPSFVKNLPGQSQLARTYVRLEPQTLSLRERTLERAYDFITQMANYLGVSGGDQVVRPTVRFYDILVEKKFVRGRDSRLVKAACLYIACRDNNIPFLLIEFSEYLRVNIYVLGVVFLLLCKELHLEEHPIIQKLVDPSLFIHRFAKSLLGEDNHDVELTALRIMTSMKLHWMQTGIKPSGLCGAALYISSLAHGIKLSKTEIVRKAHICEATLTKRLIDFEGTESGGLTIEELNQRAQALEDNYKSGKHINLVNKMSKEELLCEHRDSVKPQFAHGLCETCYYEFISISGGLDGGADSLLESSTVDHSCNSLNMGKETIFGAAGIYQITKAGSEDHDMGIEGEESENLTDINDEKVASYLHNEEEQRLKKLIWEEMSRDYTKEQADKAEETLADFENGLKEILYAKKLADEAASNYAKLKLV